MQECHSGARTSLEEALAHAATDRLLRVPMAVDQFIPRTGLHLISIFYVVRGNAVHTRDLLGCLGNRRKSRHNCSGWKRNVCSRDLNPVSVDLKRRIHRISIATLDGFQRSRV